jgi:Leu/Phe-tRNA-protein transferase
MNYLKHNRLIQKIIHNKEKYLHFHPEVEVLIFIHFYKKCIRLMHNGEIMSAYFSPETTHLITLQEIDQKKNLRHNVTDNKCESVLTTSVNL